MLIRQYNQSELDALRSIHAAQGFEYALPDLRNPLFLTKLVLTNEPSPQAAATTPSRVTSHESPVTSHVTVADRDVPATTAGNSHILGAAFLRLTAEAYLLLDPRAGTPRERWQWLLALHEAARHDAWQRGLEDVHAWLPPPIAQKFGRRLARLGWRRDDSWTPYCLRFSS